MTVLVPSPTRPTQSSAAVLPSASSPPSAHQPITPPRLQQVRVPPYPSRYPYRSSPSTYTSPSNSSFFFPSSPPSHLLSPISPSPHRLVRPRPCTFPATPPPFAVASDLCRFPVLSVSSSACSRTSRVLFQRRNLDQTPILLYISCVLLAELHPTY